MHSSHQIVSGFHIVVDVCLKSSILIKSILDHIHKWLTPKMLLGYIMNFFIHLMIAESYFISVGLVLYLISVLYVKFFLPYESSD